MSLRRCQQNAQPCDIRFSRGGLFLEQSFRRAEKIRLDLVANTAELLNLGGAVAKGLN
jgi:hypothetical protein